MSDLSKSEVEDIVEATVIRTLGNLGVDLTTPEAKREWLEDMLYTRAWRKSVQRGTKIGVGTMITVIVTGLLGVVWMGFTGMFHGGMP
jgi:hypothetical protein